MGTVKAKRCSVRDCPHPREDGSQWCEHHRHALAHAGQPRPHERRRPSPPSQIARQWSRERTAALTHRIDRMRREVEALDECLQRDRDEAVARLRQRIRELVDRPEVVDPSALELLDRPTLEDLLWSLKGFQDADVKAELDRYRSAVAAVTRRYAPVMQSLSEALRTFDDGADWQ